MAKPKPKAKAPKPAALRCRLPRSPAMTQKPAAGATDYSDSWTYGRVVSGVWWCASLTREPLFSTAVKSHAMISTNIATAMAAIIHDNLASGLMLPSSPIGNAAHVALVAMGSEAVSGAYLALNSPRHHRAIGPRVRK
jgi:hypothetical protein